MRRLFNFERCVVLAAFGVVALAVVLDAQPPVERDESVVAKLSALDVERIARSPGAFGRSCVVQPYLVARPRDVQLLK